MDDAGDCVAYVVTFVVRDLCTRQAWCEWLQMEISQQNAAINEENGKKKRCS